MTQGRPDFKNHVRYDPDTGHFYWKTSTSQRKAGDRADHGNVYGYRRLFVENGWHIAHRVAWLLMTGAWPETGVDHKNNDRSDNRWCNLRVATQSQNNANRRAANNRDLPKGVVRRRGKFEAWIKQNRKSQTLGTFDTADEAHNAYCRAARHIFGEFARSA